MGFLELLSRVVDICSIRVGSDFRLGRGGASGVAEMQTWGAEHGVDVYGHELLCVEGQTICATRIRQELRQGHVELAAELLGRPYMLRGIVAGVVTRVPTWVFLRQIFRCPRAFRCLPMASTRAWCWSTIPYGLPLSTWACRRRMRRCRLGASRGQLDRLCGDLYGSSVSLAFTRWLRPSRVFDSLDELIATVEGNIEDIRHNLASRGEHP